MLMMLATLRGVARAESELANLEEMRIAAHIAAALVREQYIHQAHTIIESNDSHLDHYNEVAKKTFAAVGTLRNLVQGRHEQQLADHIVAATQQLDDRFKRVILPAIQSADRATARALHADTERLVNDVVHENERLNELLAERARVARHHAADLSGHLRHLVVVCFALAIVASFAVAAATTRSTLRRLTALRASAAELAAGNLAARASVDGTDELAELSQSFNHLAEALEVNQRDKLRAETLSAVGEVAAGVAHEINNPLSVILGYSSVLRKRFELEPAQLEALSKIEAEVHQCQRIVQGLLDLARPGRREHAFLDVGRVVKDCAERIEESGLARGIEFKLDVESDATVIGDEPELRQLFTNLLCNAIEASQSHSTIEVSVARGQHWTTVRIADHGEGIPSATLPNVMKPFFSTKVSGTGLGLAIASRIVESHSGRLELESAEGAGTKATVDLPRAHAAGGVGA